MKRRRPTGMGLGIGVAAIALWPSCGGQSIRYDEGGDDEQPPTGGNGVGAHPGGGVGAYPDGGVGASTSFGGVGSTTPAGGVGATTSTGGMGPRGGEGNAPFGGASGLGGLGFGGDSGFGGVGVAGAAMGGRGIGGRFGGGGRGLGGRGMGGRFGGRMGGAGVSGAGSGGLGPNPIDGFGYFTYCTGTMVSGQNCTLTTTCNTTEPTLPGIHPTDTTVVMPGVPGVFYEMVVHVQGLVESKTYQGGVDQDGYSSIFPADGLYTGGSPSASPPSLYLLRVLSPARDYFLNSISPPAMSSVAPPGPVDYRASIVFEGGTAIRLVSADSDCKILANCGTPTASSNCNPVSVPNLDPRAAQSAPQPFPGQFLVLLVERTTVIQP